MKRRKFLTVVLAVVCLCLNCLNVLTVQADDEADQYEIDDVMRDFMQNNHLPESAVQIDGEFELIYQQTDDNGAGFSITGSNDIMRVSYGIWANMVAYNSEAGVHLFFDIRFEEDVDFTEQDALVVMYPKKMSFSGKEKFIAQSMSVNASGEWNVEFFEASMTDGSRITIFINQINQKEDINRILLCIDGTVPDNISSALPKITLTWVHRVSEKELETVIAPHVKTNPWKAIMVLLLIDLDIVAIFLIVRHIQKKRRAMNEQLKQQADISSEAEAELRHNLKLKDEDMEYLKEIGYFDPNRK